MSYQIRSFEEYQKAYRQSIEDPEAFWGDVAGEFHWRKKWDKVLEWDFKGPDVKWFQGGKLNITENCLDRHLATQGNTLALIWEPNDPKEAAVK
ncbi:MAG TPA: acetyl-coenzyme A synthetase N-terminal domain-containing protein, partial [Anseongella sp.]|nr:acetyl-coenzyme A synthetase N-terminal domain-containing protein [Anseongella sp.]